MNNPTERRNLGNGIVATSPARRQEAQQIRIKRLTPDAVLPTKAHATDSGFDLYAAEDVVIEPGESAVIPTGIAIELPAGYEATVRPRSGITAKTKLRVQLGTIDFGYTGAIGVMVDNLTAPEYRINHGSEYEEDDVSVAYDYEVHTLDNVLHFTTKTYAIGALHVKRGDKIAQLVITQLPQFEAVEVDDFTNASTRGKSGFGSSGVRQ